MPMTRVLFCLQRRNEVFRLISESYVTGIDDSCVWPAGHDREHPNSVCVECRIYTQVYFGYVYMIEFTAGAVFKSIRRLGRG